MYSHQPADYDCPFCMVAAGGGDAYTQQTDIVYRSPEAIIIVAPRWWVHNPGSLLVFPTEHYENIYDIADETLAAVYAMAKKAAIALRETYDCAGTSTRQHNEPAGGQDVWHFHVQVLPRYRNDDLYKNNDNKRFVDAAERLPFAEQLRHYFAVQR